MNHSRSTSTRCTVHLALFSLLFVHRWQIQSTGSLYYPHFHRRQCYWEYALDVCCNWRRCFPALTSKGRPRSSSTSSSASSIVVGSIAFISLSLSNRVSDQLVEVTPRHIEKKSITISELIRIGKSGVDGPWLKRICRSFFSPRHRTWDGVKWALHTEQQT